MTRLFFFLIGPVYGPLSVVELLFLLITTGCVLYVNDCLREAARLVRDAGDPVEAAIAHRDREDETWSAVVQVCFFALGVLAALQPPRPDTPDDPSVVAVSLASTGLILLAQLFAAWRAYRRRRNRFVINAAIREAAADDADYAVVPRRRGGRRAYDQRRGP